jgi:hypothetical protein
MVLVLNYAHMKIPAPNVAAKKTTEMGAQSLKQKRK